MKLELKHLAGYLPYGLRVNIRQERQVSREEWKWFETENILNGSFLTWNLENLTPILRPLSDLTKEIEVNGEKFVPIDFNAFEYSKEDIIEFQNRFIHYKGMKFGIIERLFEWHFDIYGLIPKGLAIDINTL